MIAPPILTAENVASFDAALNMALQVPATWLITLWNADMAALRWKDKKPLIAQREFNAQWELMREDQRAAVLTAFVEARLS